MNHNLIRTAVYATLAFAMVGCAQLPVDSPQSTTSPSAISVPGIIINGIQLTQAKQADYKVGRFAGLPLVKTDADFAALDGLIGQYQEIALVSAKKKDWDTFLASRQLARYLTEYRLYVTASSLAAYQGMADKRGLMTLQPGAYAVIPAYNRQDQTLSNLSMDESMFIGNGVQVADASDDLTNLIRNVNQAIKEAADSKNPSFNANVNRKILGSLPEGQAFRASDAAGNQYLIEKSGDSFIFHNPGKKPVQFKPEQLGFIPRLAAPDSVRTQAKQIVDNLNKIEANIARSQNYYGGGGWAIPPNTYYASSMGNFLLDDRGVPTSDKAAIERGKQAYKNNPSYKMAMGMFSKSLFNWPEYSSFSNTCKEVGQNNGITTWAYRGAGAEIAELSCLDFTQSRTLRYQRSFYVASNLSLQTFDSMLKDEKLRDEINHAVGLTKLADALAQFLPMYGNIDSAGSCATGKSITERLLRSGMADLNVTELSSFVGLAESDSAMDQTLNCIGAIPLVGATASKAAKVAKAFKIPKTEAIVARATNLSTVFKSDSIFNKPWTAVSGVLEKNLGNSSGSTALVRNLYDGVQKSYNFYSLGDAVNQWKAIYLG